MSMEKENPTDKKWYIKFQTGIIEGPFDTYEMDEKFQSFKINEKTKIKMKEEDYYYYLGKYVKRYYKMKLEDKLDLKKAKNKISKKISNFRKGKFIFKKNQDIEEFTPHIREERILSSAVRPKLIFLGDMLPENSDEEEEHCYSRLRANTMNR